MEEIDEFLLLDVGRDHPFIITHIVGFVYSDVARGEGLIFRGIVIFISYDL